MVSSFSIVVLFKFDTTVEKFLSVDVSEATDAVDNTCWLFFDFENISVENELWGLVFTGGTVVVVDSEGGPLVDNVSGPNFVVSFVKFEEPVVLNKDG